MPGDEQQLRKRICQIGQLMHQQGYIDGIGGNISARLDDDRFLVTPSGIAKGFMTPNELIIVDIDGNRVDDVLPENYNLRPTSEISMHLECFRQRPDVNGVVHAHPQNAVALTIAGYDFGQFLIPEVTVLMGVIPTAPYSTPSSTENRDAIRGLIESHDVILLSNHGSLTVGGTVWDAYLLLETLEHTASIFYKVETLGGPRALIPVEQVKKLIAMREKIGLSRPGDDSRFQDVLDKQISKFDEINP